MKKIYSDPEIQIINVSAVDIITTSGDCDPAENDIAWALNLQ